MKRQTPLLEPISISIKQDRGGIGLVTEEMRKFRKAAAAATSSTSSSSLHQIEGETPESYRTRISQSRAEKRAEAQLYAAQNILEGYCCSADANAGAVQNPQEIDLDIDDTNPTTTTTTFTTATELDANNTTPSTTPLHAIPLLYRSLVRYRRLREQRQRERFSLAEGLATHHLTATATSSSLAKFAPESDGEEEEDESIASTALFAHDAPLTQLAHDEDEDDADVEDPELEEWEALSFVERRDRVVRELRERWRYCFWCKYRYRDEGEMEEGCPGEEEDVHG
ncbi:hypothetical protein DFH27DRAFT_575605 [Peziza echinospora]|nr:hypothetical protein DFH27DRAFT_575605 [Peziza echinospora]